MLKLFLLFLEGICFWFGEALKMCCVYAMKRAMEKFTKNSREYEQQTMEKGKKIHLEQPAEISLCELSSPSAFA
jgi:hypothetical protein